MYSLLRKSSSFTTLNGGLLPPVASVSEVCSTDLPLLLNQQLLPLQSKQIAHVTRFIISNPLISLLLWLEIVAFYYPFRLSEAISWKSHHNSLQSPQNEFLFMALQPQHFYCSSMRQRKTIFNKLLPSSLPANAVQLHPCLLPPEHSQFTRAASEVCSQVSGFQGFAAAGRAAETNSQQQVPTACDWNDLPGLSQGYGPCYHSPWVLQDVPYPSIPQILRNKRIWMTNATIPSKPDLWRTPSTAPKSPVIYIFHQQAPWASPSSCWFPTRSHLETSENDWAP